jgi:tRNA-(ms[2]io[6]A)-hydroxylase
MTGSASSAVADVLEFLPCATPEQWFEQALEHIPTLLIDHANCEKKAAGTALSLMFRYVERPELLQQLSRLAREELRHFEQVHEIMGARGVSYVHLSSSRYAGGLRKLIGHTEPQRVVDTLLTGAVVEARSCERFLGLVAVLPADLGQFYARLLDSEARHFRNYLGLAQQCATPELAESIPARLDALLEVEKGLVCEPDTVFRFHSGPLVQSTPTES